MGNIYSNNNIITLLKKYKDISVSDSNLHFVDTKTFDLMPEQGEGFQDETNWGFLFKRKVEHQELHIYMLRHGG